MPLGMTVVDLAQVAGAVIAAIALIAALVTVWLTITNERKRTQPIVIVRHLNATGDDVFASATNRGAGPAFNVRIGAEWPRCKPTYLTGKVSAVLDAGGKIEKATLKIPSQAERRGEPVAYLAAYENASGDLDHENAARSGQTARYSAGALPPHPWAPSSTQLAASPSRLLCRVNRTR